MCMCALCVFMYCVCACVYCVCVQWESEDNLRCWFVLTFYLVLGGVLFVVCTALHTPSCLARECLGDFTVSASHLRTCFSMSSVDSRNLNLGCQAYAAS